MHSWDVSYSCFLWLPLKYTSLYLNFFFFLAPSPIYPGMQELSHSGLMVGKRRYALSFPVVTCSHPSNFDAITLWNLKFKMKLLIYNSIICFHISVCNINIPA